MHKVFQAEIDLRAAAVKIGLSITYSKEALTKQH
jgi:hypothetical protein